MDDNATNDANGNEVRVVPVAIVGMSCRFPGDATDPEKLYKLCAEARDGWSEVPSDRYNIDGFYHPDTNRSGAVYSRGGHYMKEDLGRFDANFFNIKASEAKSMDPQQRILLECTYEALENAGIRMESVADSNTGVYVGSFCRDYRDEVYWDPEQIPVYSSTGTEQSMLSNRISYFYDLKGPSLSVDTACSSSLAAFHIACQSLRTGESQQAIVGGANLMIGPNLPISLSMMSFLSPDGRSFTFDARANGYGRGEGVACLILKRLETAILDGDNIRAIVRSTGMNQDGRTSSLTVPSGDAQEDLIRKVYASAGLNPLHTQYVEAHGTGTPTGDPIETAALARVFGPGRSAEKPLLIGSIKTNLGHLEGASGLAGLIKATLMIEKGYILPNRSLEKPSDRIPFEEWNLKVPTVIEPWNDPLRRASINSFGFGGANVHVVLENKRDVKAQSAEGKHSPISSDTSQSEGTKNELTSTNSSRKRIYLVSAKDENSGKRYAQQLGAYLEENSTPSEHELLGGLARTLGERRSLLPMRTAVVAEDIRELATALLKVDLPFSRSSKRLNIAFVFTGQGAQWAGMGRELIGSYPIFQKALTAADECLRSFGARWSLIEELLRDAKTSQIGTAAMSQPICTALQLSLVALLESWNIKPFRVVGHSSGEIAAAYTAGALDFESCMRIAYFRGSAVKELSETHPELHGAMLAVGTSHEEIKPLLCQLEKGQAGVACINSSSSTTISGDEPAITELQGILEGKNVFARKLRVDVAYHSHHMQAVRESYRRDLNGITSESSSTVEMFSSVTGELVNVAKLGPDYWVQNLVCPVLFSQALERLLHQRGAHKATPEADVIVEIGPHASLSGPINDILASGGSKNDENILVKSAIIRGKDASKTMMQLGADLVVKGCPVDLSAVNLTTDKNSFPLLVNLPPYPWNHTQSFWHETRQSRDYRFRSHPRNDIVGAITSDSSSLEPQWRNIIRPKEMPWVKDHIIQSQTIYPAAGYIAMAIEACRQHSQLQNITICGYALRQISIVRALVIPDSTEGIETRIALRPYNESHRASSDIWYEFRITSWSAERGWNEHCSGLISVQAEPKSNEVDDGRNKRSQKSFYERQVMSMLATCTNKLNVPELYRRLDQVGMNFGITFCGLEQVHTAEGFSIATLSIPNTPAVMPLGFEYPHVIHPATLDTMFQPFFPAISGTTESIQSAMVPVFIEEIFISDTISKIPGQKLNVYATVSVKSRRQIFASNFVLDKSRGGYEPVLTVKGLRGVLLPPENLENPKFKIRNLCFREEWAPAIRLLTENQLYRVLEGTGKSEALDEVQIKALERASLYHIEKALDALANDKRDQWLHHHRLLFDWMVTTSRSDSVSASCADSKERAISLPDTISYAPHEGILLQRIGQNLPQILRGDINPGSIFSEEGILQDWLSSSDSFCRANSQAVRLVDLLAHDNPNLSILDIGGRAGTAATHVLQVLGGSEGRDPRFGHYHVAARDNDYLAEVREMLQPWGELVGFSNLEIENNPTRQGFASGSYDLIIASDLLVATGLMERTMRNVRKLLKPRGKLVLIEMTGAAVQHYLIFGSLPNWWLGEEEHRALGGPLSRTEWDSLLRRTGFSGLDVPTEPDSIDKTYSMLLSTRTRDDPADFPPVNIITERPPQDPLVQSLTASLGSLTRNDVTSSPLVEIQDYQGVVVVLSELDHTFLTDSTLEQFNAVKTLLLNVDGILWAVRHSTSDSTYATGSFMTGFARALKSENSSKKVVVLNMENDSNSLPDDMVASTIQKVFEATFDTNLSGEQDDMEYVVKDGCLHIPRMLPDPQMNKRIASQMGNITEELQPFYQKGRPLRLDIQNPGLLNTFHFVDDECYNDKLPDDFVEVEIKAAGINFRDLMISTGHIDLDSLGTEFSGIITAMGKSVRGLSNGDRVLGFGSGTFANSVRCGAAEVYPFPECLSFEAAASLPVAFCTAYYALYDMAHLRKGESVLIHSAAGAFGQAAIMLAQLQGARIFVTVGTDEKRRFLVDKYQIPADNIFSSRDNNFARGIMEATSDKGVDVILNSLSGEGLRMTWECIARFGRFVEVGKRDIYLNTRLEMTQFQRNVIFASVDMRLIQRKRTKMLQVLLSEVVALIRENKIRPVEPINVFPMSNIEGAFRIMQHGKHRGKLIIKPKADDMVMALPPATNETGIRADASYLLVGGLGGIGRSLATWLVSQGAKNLIFASRSGRSSRHAETLVTEIESLGAMAAIYACDVTDIRQLQSVLEDSAKSMPPIRGVIQGAMVLRDSIFENMSFEDYIAVVGPKVQGTFNLHDCLSKTDFDFFIMLSSVAGIIGNPGQTAYAGSSTFMDAFARYRAQLGLPAVSIDLGVIKDVGYVAENDKLQPALDKIALDEIAEDELRALVSVAISEQRQTHGKHHIITGIDMKHRGNNAPLPVWARNPRFSALSRLQIRKDGDQDGEGGTKDLGRLVKESKTIDEASGLVTTGILKKISEIMTIPVEEVDANEPAAAYGLDSLAAVELRNWLKQELKSNMRLFELLTNVSISQLSSQVVAKSALFDPKQDVQGA